MRRKGATGEATGVRAQLNLLVATTTAVVLAAFLAPLGIALRNTTEQRAIAEATTAAQSAATLVALGQLPTGDSLSVVYGDEVSDSPAVELARRGMAFSASTSGGVQVLVPVQGLGSGTAVVRVFVPETVLRQGVAGSWALLAAIGAALVGLSLLIADRLGRRLVGSVTALAATADRLAAGDTTARMNPSGPPEVRRVGAELNRLAARIEELLLAEREEVASLAHRLRTPLTALRLDVDALTDHGEQARLVAGVETLRREVDELIRTARRPLRSGVHPHADLTAIVVERARFWSVLAEDSGRRLEVEAPADELRVAVPEADLTAALDALLDNVFSHTPDATPLRVMAARTPEGAVLIVEDGGPGLGDAALRRGVSTGSTGLGLDIARRTAEAAGGTLRVGASNLGGALVELAFRTV